MKPRIVAFVDHEIGFRLLEKLISLSLSNRIELLAAVTTVENDKMWWPSVKGLCRKSEIPLFIYEEPFEDTLILKNVDWYLLLSWKHIIPNKLIAHPTYGVVNLHYSLLPSYRGVYPVNWAIIDGLDKTGITFHFVNEKIDEGEIILQAEAPILLSDTARSLQIRLDELAYESFDTLITFLCDLNTNTLPSAKNEKRHRYYSRDSFNKICEIDIDKTYQGNELFNLLRGLTFFGETKNAYVIDKKTRKKIYISVELNEEV